MLIAQKALRGIFIDLHMDAESRGVVVNHDLLLSEPKAKSGCTYDVVNVAIDGLLQVNVRGLYLIDVSLNVGESLNSLLKAHVAPPLLDAKCCALTNDQVDRQLLEALAEEPRPHRLLHPRNRSLLLKQGFEEAEELLLVLPCHDSVVV